MEKFKLLSFLPLKSEEGAIPINNPSQPTEYQNFQTTKRRDNEGSKDNINTNHAEDFIIINHVNLEPPVEPILNLDEINEEMTIGQYFDYKNHLQVEMNFVPFV